MRSGLAQGRRSDFRRFVQPTEQSTEYFRDVMQRLDAYHVFHSFLNEGTRPFAEISFSRGDSQQNIDEERVDRSCSSKTASR
jgi:hypothetical protein